MLKINYGLLDITASDDAVSVVTDIQPFANAQDINTPDLDQLSVKKNATMELNQWVLDGTFETFPNNPEAEKWGLWSKQMSNENGDFSEEILLTIEFDDNHTSEGLTLYFRPDTGEYSSDFTIDYYDSSNNLIISKDFSANSAEYFASSPVENYRKIIITFRKTSLPYRYLKLTEIKYGSVKIFNDDSIVSATILEEIDPTCGELSVNTMECTIYTDDFQLLDPQGIYQMLQQKQAINIKSYDNAGNSTDYGTFFLEEPTSEDDDTTTLSCVDLLGVIDKTTFMGGIFERYNAGLLFDDIMNSAEVDTSEYEIEEALREKTITGFIPICTHREAVQQWAFAVGAIVDCSRDKKIKAYSAQTDSVGTIAHDDKFIGHKVTLKPLVTGVNITAHSYSVDENVSTAYEGMLLKGDNLVTFNSPYKELTVSGGTLKTNGANYAIVNMAEAGKAVISGKPYVDNTTVYSINASELPANAKPNIIEIGANATLVNSDNALEIAQRVYAYNQNRYQDDGEIVLGNQRVGEITRLNSLNNRDIVGNLTRLEIDLITETANITMAGVSEERID